MKFVVTGGRGFIDITFSAALSVGHRCIDARDEIAVLLNSSGYGFCLSKVLSPASKCITGIFL